MFIELEKMLPEEIERVLNLLSSELLKKNGKLKIDNYTSVKSVIENLMS